MAEAVAVVGLVSSIVQFVDFGTRVAKRLAEFSADVNVVPKSFHEINIQLPLILITLQQTKLQADAHHLSEATASVLDPVIDECLSQVKELEIILAKALPNDQDSTWKRRKKALTSLRHDKAVAQIQTSLERQINVLTNYQTIKISSPSTRLPVREALRPGGTLSKIAEARPCFMVPFEQDPNFVGRDEEIKETKIQFDAHQHRVVLSGIGGVGKSQIAIEYSYRYREQHPGAHIFWVHAGNHARFEESYQQIATALAMPGLDDPNQQTLKLVQDWFNENANGDWLMILDNMDDIDIVFGRKAGVPEGGMMKTIMQWLPRFSAGLVIITTRDRRLGERMVPGKKPIAIEPMNMKDAELLLSKRLPEGYGGDEVLSRQLLEFLDLLPLAITQATAFITENGISVAEYLDIIRSSDSEMKDFLATENHDPGRDAGMSNSVLHTWKVSFDQIRRQNALAPAILSLMSCFDRQSIPETLLFQKQDSRIAFVSAIGTLKAFSLISSERSNEVFRMHRLVQLATQRWLEMDGSVGEWQAGALSAVFASLPKDAYPHNWHLWETIHPHVMKILDQSSPKESRSDYYSLTRASILQDLGEYNVTRGRFESGRQQLQECLSTRESLLDPNDVAILDIMLRLSRNHTADGWPADAKNNILEVWRRSKLLVDDAARSAIIQDALFITGQIWIAEQKWEEAEMLYRWMCSLHGEREYVIYYKCCLLEVWSRQGGAKLVDADEMHQQIMTSIGSEEISELFILRGLGMNMDHLCRMEAYDDASALSSRIVGSYRTVVGEDHTDYKSVLRRHDQLLTIIQKTSSP